MSIHITSVDDVLNSVSDLKPNTVISLLTVSEYNNSRLKYRRNVVENSVDNWIMCHMEDTYKEDRPESPTKEKVEILLNSVKDVQPSEILVHCFAGISRSPALAISILAQWELSKNVNCDLKDVVRKVFEIRPIACPNRLILKFADEILNTNGILQQTSEELIYNQLIKAQ